MRIILLVIFLFITTIGCVRTSIPQVYDNPVEKEYESSNKEEILSKTFEVTVTEQEYLGKSAVKNKRFKTTFEGVRTIRIKYKGSIKELKDEDEYVTNNEDIWFETSIGDVLIIICDKNGDIIEWSFKGEINENIK